MSALCRVLSFAKEERRIKSHPSSSFQRRYKSDNRGTAATLLCEAGATRQEIAEALCWTVEKANKMFET